MWEYVKFWAMVLGFLGIGFTLFIGLWIVAQSYLDWRHGRRVQAGLEKAVDRQFGDRPFPGGE